MTWIEGLAIGGSITGGILSLPLIVGAIGFTSTGIAGGSMAASMMSSAAIANGGGVATGSLVAICQSIGAAGLAATTKGIAVAAGTSIIALFK